MYTNKLHYVFFEISKNAVGCKLKIKNYVVTLPKCALGSQKVFLSYTKFMFMILWYVANLK